MYPYGRQLKPHCSHIQENALQDALPHEVRSLIEQLGSNLKTARLNRNLTTQEVAEKLGASRNLIAAAEQDRLGSSIALYTALLWLYDLCITHSTSSPPPTQMR